MVYVEPTFPRGQIKNASASAGEQRPQKKFKSSGYGASTTIEDRKFKPSRNQRKQIRDAITEQESEEFEHQIKAAPLSFNTLQEDMLVIGCVHKVRPMDLSISLPGKMSGTVPITAISKSYCARLQSFVDHPESEDDPCPQLEDLYEMGDIVYVKVIKKRAGESLQLSLSPSDLHAGMNHKLLKQGAVLSVAVQEVEDHGYIMETGIKHVTAFLPRKNIKKNTPSIGQNVCCFIEKVTHTSNSSTVILKAFKPNEKREMQMEHNDTINIDTVVPGTSVSFTVTNILKNGLQGKIFNDQITAYVNQNQLLKTLSMPEDYSMFKLVEGKIMYVMPLTKHVFVTLCSTEGNKIVPDTTLGIGSTVEKARVIRKSEKGVLFRIGKNTKALLLVSSLKKLMSDNFDEDIILSKYQPDSEHRIRILKYEMFDRVYTCTDDEELVEMQYFKASDLQLNSCYDCRITGFLDSDNGYRIVIDNVNGFLGGYNVDTSRKYAINEVVKVRILEVDDEKNNVQTNNRNEFMENPQKVLFDRQSAVVGRSYLGTVVKEYDKYFLVKFFGNIVGILFKICFNRRQNNYMISNLKPGSITEFEIHENIEGKPLNLIIPYNKTENLGEMFEAVVKAVYPTGVDITNEDGSITGTIPPTYLSEFMSLNMPLFNNIKDEEHIQVVSIKDSIYSVRDVEYLLNNPHEFKRVRVGQVLRAYVVRQKKSKLVLKLALKDYQEEIKLKLEDFVENCADVKFVEDQIVMVRIMDKVSNPEPLLTVSAKLQDVCNHGPNGAWTWICKYLCDVQNLAKRFKENGKSIGSLAIGQEVSCTLHNILDEEGQVVLRINSVDDELYGIAEKDGDTEYNTGDEINGKIVWIDYEKQLVNICIKKKHMKHIQEDQTVIEDLIVQEKTYTFVLLFSNQHINVGYLKKTSGPLVYVPARCHYNDFGASKLEAKSKITLIRAYNDKVIGLEESQNALLQTLKKVFIQNNKDNRNFNEPNSPRKWEDRKPFVKNYRLRSKGNIKAVWLPPFVNAEDEEAKEFCEDDEDYEDVSDNEDVKPELTNAESIEENGQEEDNAKKASKIKKNASKKKLGKKKEKKIPQLDGICDFNCEFEDELTELFKNQLDGAADVAAKPIKEKKNKAKSVSKKVVNGKKIKKVHKPITEAKKNLKSKEKKVKKVEKTAEKSSVDDENEDVTADAPPTTENKADERKQKRKLRLLLQKAKNKGCEETKKLIKAQKRANKKLKKQRLLSEKKTASNKTVNPKMLKIKEKRQLKRQRILDLKTIGTVTPEEEKMLEQYKLKQKERKILRKQRLTKALEDASTSAKQKKIIEEKLQKKKEQKKLRRQRLRASQKKVTPTVEKPEKIAKEANGDKEDKKKKKKKQPKEVVAPASQNGKIKKPKLKKVKKTKTIPQLDGASDCDFDLDLENVLNQLFKHQLDGAADMGKMHFKHHSPKTHGGGANDDKNKNPKGVGKDKKHAKKVDAAPSKSMEKKQKQAKSNETVKDSQGKTPDNEQEQNRRKKLKKVLEAQKKMAGKGTDNKVVKSEESISAKADKPAQTKQNMKKKLKNKNQNKKEKLEGNQDSKKSSALKKKKPGMKQLVSKNKEASSAKTPEATPEPGVEITKEERRRLRNLKKKLRAKKLKLKKDLIKKMKLAKKAKQQSPAVKDTSEQTLPLQTTAVPEEKKVVEPAKENLKKSKFKKDLIKKLKLAQQQSPQLTLQTATVPEAKKEEKPPKEKSNIRSEFKNELIKKLKQAQHKSPVVKNTPALTLHREEEKKQKPAKEKSKNMSEFRKELKKQLKMAQQQSPVVEESPELTLPSAPVPEVEKEEKPAKEKSENKSEFKKGLKKKLKNAQQQSPVVEESPELILPTAQVPEVEKEEKPAKENLKRKPTAKTLPGADNFWNVNQEQDKDEDSSSDDEEETSAPAKKRLTHAERFEAIKAEEKRIRKIEDELADPTIEPHTPDQFERLVLATPNSSLLWIKYMVFHMESAELDKARAIASKALKTIYFREEDEKLNVWIALLNLEIRYGTTESYKEVLKEAVQLNDQFQLYSRVMQILTDCKKDQEIVEMIAVLLKKFKQNSEMWTLVATAFYETGAPEKAKELLSRALKSLRNDEHVPLIIKFAFLHNKYDEKDESHILFEQLLASYPKRTDIWSQYVDMLVKDGQLDIARQVLDRAIAQRLPMRKMKTLYTKYVQFEEKHGDLEAVRKVKHLAAEYVKSQTEGKDE